MRTQILWSSGFTTFEKIPAKLFRAASDQVFKKRSGNFKHQLHKDEVEFQGGDTIEFWQRAEDGNKGTA